MMISKTLQERFDNTESSNGAQETTIANINDSLDRYLSNGITVSDDGSTIFDTQPGIVAIEAFTGNVASSIVLADPDDPTENDGEFGECLEFYDVSGKAHTITIDGAGTFLGSKTTLTFDGTVGSFVLLRRVKSGDNYFFAIGPSSGVTAS